MLTCLRIKNLAVIDDLTWNLHSGFNILTGETGAGKSILIDAFQLLLGERADRSMIRDGADNCVVEGVIETNKSLEKFLEEQGIEPSGDDGLILKRIFSTQGQNRQFINGSPTTLQILKSLGDRIVDIHGPHDHQSLLSTDTQLEALDAYGKHEKELDTYRSLFREQNADLRTLEELKQTAQGDWQKHLDFLNFQISEIEQANPQPWEIDQLQREYQLASHSRRIIELAAQIENILSGGENDVTSGLASVEKLLTEWERIDPQASGLRELNNSALVQLQELQSDVQKLAGNTELDGDRLQEIEARLNLLQSLHRKHGPDILARLDEIRTERDHLASRESRIDELQSRIDSRTPKLSAAANALTKLREKASPKLADAITKQLRELGFKQAGFGVSISPLSKPSSSGNDSIEFQFSPNFGESSRALRAIASSGEMARVMLAVKTVLAEQDQVPILIFDEVDANVGGETAIAVGKKLRELAESHQVLCITHLPQVAASGHVHFRVGKKTQQGRTVASIEELDSEKRIEEISRMLGGTSDSARALAESLLGEKKISAKKSKH